MFGIIDCVQDLFLQFLVDTREASAMANLHAVFVKFLQPVAQRHSQQPHKPRHLFNGARPVLGRKRIDGQNFDTEFDRGLEDRLNVIDTGAMSDISNQASFLCPAAIPVHDNPHMIGNPGERGESGVDQVFRTLPNCTGAAQWNTDSL